MQASFLSSFPPVVRLACAAILAAILTLAAPAAAQTGQGRYIEADLVAEGRPVQGETLWLAMRFRPQDGWHGYWANPGEAGLGMQLDWQVPAHWRVGEPLYPVPQVLTFFGIANHAYKDDYAVLIPVEIGRTAIPPTLLPESVTARWLACSDELCVPEGAVLQLRYPPESATLAQQFDSYRAAIPPLLDQEGRYALTGSTLRLALPLPAAVDLPDPHLFVETTDLVDYGGRQRFFRDGDTLIVEVPLPRSAARADRVSGILAFDDGGMGVRFTARAGDVPRGGRAIGGGAGHTPLLVLIGGALLGGLLLNLMPCVFPVLSLKALTLARAGASERAARREGVAYTAGVVVACLALGGLLLALRAGGEQIGWAFQLQQPLVVAALLAVAMWITANLAGLYEVPSLPIRGSGEGGAFSTGLLAAFVATPCTGPFMAAALGAALLLDWWLALLLFASLGLGLALPFLALGFVPTMRRLLPRPGPWMERFRRIMAIPMGLTAAALVWLAWRLAGGSFAFAGVAIGILPVVALIARRNGNAVISILALMGTAYFAASLPFRMEERASIADSVLDPVAYSEDALAEARAGGAPVFLWFTADWCVTCKVNESVAIEREATRAAFEEAGVVAMRGDWSRGDPAITRYLESQGAAGVPLYVWYPADGGEGERLPQVLTPDMLTERAGR